MKNMNNTPILAPRREWWDRGKSEKLAAEIKRIIFANNSVIVNDFDESWDASEDYSGHIKVYLRKTYNEVIILPDAGLTIRANEDMSGMFAEFTSLEFIEGIGEHLDTSNARKMSDLFKHCVSLKRLDLSNWDVAKVESFRGTFCCGHNQVGDAALEVLNLNGWDVSSARDMAYMFYGCGKLKEVSVDNWNVSKVQNLRHTFADCFSLKKLKVKKWNTESVKTFDGIFNDCRTLKSIDISGWNTINCLEFDQMFDNCCNLRKIIGLENMDTSNGISFEEMFFGCRKLRKLDLSSFDTRSVHGREFLAWESNIQSKSNMKNMFSGCNSLSSLILGNKFTLSTENDNAFMNNVFLERLNKDGYVIASPETDSMTPLLRPKMDQAIFRKKTNYSKNDIVLFRSENRTKLVMHRIKSVLKNGYMICGDNDRCAEYVPVEVVFAAMTEMFRKDKHYRCDGLRYYLLSWGCRQFSYWLRIYREDEALFWRIVRKLRRKIKKIGGRF